MRDPVTMTEDELGASDVEDEDAVVYTRGIGSPVYGEDGEEIGHVALIDCDDADELSVHTLADAVDGYVALWRSSPGSFHLWALQPASLSDVVMDVLDMRIADAEHVAQSRRRRSFVLRAAPKVFESGETYKDAPELLATYDDGTGDVARGHYAVVREHGGDEVDEERLRGAREVETHSYMTVTDATKEDLR